MMFRAVPSWPRTSISVRPLNNYLVSYAVMMFRAVHSWPRTSISVRPN